MKLVVLKEHYQRQDLRSIVGKINTHKKAVSYTHVIPPSYVTVVFTLEYWIVFALDTIRFLKCHFIPLGLLQRCGMENSMYRDIFFNFCFTSAMHIGNSGEYTHCKSNQIGRDTHRTNITVVDVVVIVVVVLWCSISKQVLVYLFLLLSTNTTVWCWRLIHGFVKVLDIPDCWSSAPATLWWHQIHDFRSYSNRWPLKAIGCSCVCVSSAVVEFTFKSNYKLSINLAEISNLAHAITVAFPFKYPIERRLGAREVRIEALGQGGAKGNTALYGRQRCGSGAAGHHDGDWRKSRTTACRHSALERSNDTLLTLP